MGTHWGHRDPPSAGPAGAARGRQWHSPGWGRGASETPKPPGTPQKRGHPQNRDIPVPGGHRGAQRGPAGATRVPTVTQPWGEVSLRGKEFPAGIPCPSPGAGTGGDRGPGGSRDFPGDSNLSPRPDPFSPHSPRKVPATPPHSPAAPAFPSPIFHGIARFSLCSIPYSPTLGSVRNLQQLGSLYWILGGIWARGGPPWLPLSPAPYWDPLGGSRHLPRVRRWPRSPFSCPGRDSKAPEGKQQIFCIFPICSQDVARAEAAPQRLRMSLVGLGGTLQVALGRREVLGTLSSCVGTQIPAGCPQRGSGGVPQLRELQQRGCGAFGGWCWPWGQAELGDRPGGTRRRVTGPCSQGNPDGATAGPVLLLAVCAVPWEWGLGVGTCWAQPGTGSVSQAFQDTGMSPHVVSLLAGSAWTRRWLRLDLPFVPWLGKSPKFHLTHGIPRVWKGWRG